jgi:hypothetical protein
LFLPNVLNESTFVGRRQWSLAGFDPFVDGSFLVLCFFLFFDFLIKDGILRRLVFSLRRTGFKGNGDFQRSVGQKKRKSSNNTWKYMIAIFFSIGMCAYFMNDRETDSAAAVEKELTDGTVTTKVGTTTTVVDNNGTVTTTTTTTVVDTDTRIGGKDAVVVPPPDTAPSPQLQRRLQRRLQSLSRLRNRRGIRGLDVTRSAYCCIAYR